MKRAYDFHIHTGASPCGDDSMTPNNIVNMALLKGLDAIAITDHNTCANVQAVVELAKDTSLAVIPGIEIETSEEFHAILLFESIDQLVEMQEIINLNLPKLNNRPDIFGKQTIYNSRDEKIGEIDQLLLTATALSIYQLIPIVKKIGGICYPAHIDRPSYSMISSLGFIPPDLAIRHIEVSKHVNINNFRKTYPELSIIQSSDAHYLGDILERQSYMEVEENTPSKWIEFLKK